jgi:hypothetical protein
MARPAVVLPSLAVYTTVSLFSLNNDTAATFLGEATARNLIEACS